MRFNLSLNGLNPSDELKRHKALSTRYRAKLAAMGRRRNWLWRDVLASAVYHEEQAAKLKREGVR